jgi:hypothetical protein
MSQFNANNSVFNAVAGNQHNIIYMPITITVYSSPAPPSPHPLHPLRPLSTPSPPHLSPPRPLSALSALPAPSSPSPRPLRPPRPLPERVSSSASPGALSSAVSAKNSLGRFATATDSEFMMLNYPSTVSVGLQYSFCLYFSSVLT